MATQCAASFLAGSFSIRKASFPFLEAGGSTSTHLTVLQLPIGMLTALDFGLEGGWDMHDPSWPDIFPTGRRGLAPCQPPRGHSPELVELPPTCHGHHGLVGCSVENKGKWQPRVGRAEDGRFKASSQQQ